MCGERHKGKKRAEDMMLGFYEAIGQLAMANSVCWYGHVLRREDGHILRGALWFA